LHPSGCARIYDSGLPDPVHHGAYQHPPEELPTEVLQFVGAGANVLSFGRFQNAEGFAAALA